MTSQVNGYSYKPAPLGISRSLSRYNQERRGESKTHKIG